MECPNCKRELSIPDIAINYSTRYVKECIVKTLCCKTLVKLHPQVQFKVKTYTGPELKDDWGQ